MLQVEEVLPRRAPARNRLQPFAAFSLDWGLLVLRINEVLLLLLWVCDAVAHICVVPNKKGGRSHDRSSKSIHVKSNRSDNLDTQTKAPTITRARAKPRTHARTRMHLQQLPVLAYSLDTSLRQALR